MRSIIYAVALALALVSQAHARMYMIECDDLYPEAGSPDHTTAIAEVQRDLDGTPIGLKCYLVEGDPNDVCTIGDGACCPCSVARGFTPECTVLVAYTDSATSGACLNKFPACYYGNGCGDPALGIPPATATVTESPDAVTRHSKRRHRRR